MSDVRFSNSQLVEIKEAQSIVSSTLRPTVPALESILFTPFPILDHGFIRAVDYMGNDVSVVQAARVSYGRGTKQLQDDSALIRYMMRNRHSSVFEMCEIKFHVKLPIFVARQWIRHRTANVNEISARYSILEKEFYIPDASVLAEQSTTNRQGRGNVISAEEAKLIQTILTDDATCNYKDYESLLNDPTSPNYDPTRPRLARELARMNLTLNTYTQWYWKIDLHNLFHFLGLRVDPHAQYEIRVYAEKMLDILKLWVPIATQAFLDYSVGAKTLSRMEVELVRDLFQEHIHNQTTITPLIRKLSGADNGGAEERALADKYGMSGRELREFITAFFKG